MSLQWLPVDQVTPWDHNPRHNDHAVHPVAKLILRFGFINPMVVWTSRGRLVAGHTRLKAFQWLQCWRPVEDGEVKPRWTTGAGWAPWDGSSFAASNAPGPGVVPVLFHEFEDEAAAVAYALADNKSNELADWDDGKLGELLRGLGGDALDLGWVSSELDALVDPAKLEDVTWKTFDETIGAVAGGGAPAIGGKARAMKKTSFGWRKKLKVGTVLAADVEVMEFVSKGRNHKHDRVEYAFCTGGSGVVVVDGDEVEVVQGEVVAIAAGKKHHMRPDKGGLRMLIAYSAEVA